MDRSVNIPDIAGGGVDYPVRLDIAEQEFAHATPLYADAMLYCGVAIRNRVHAKHSSTLRKPDFLSVRLVLEGTEYLRYNGSTFLIEAGDLTILQPYRDYGFKTGPDGYCVKYNITLKGSMLNEVIHHAGLLNSFCIHPKDTEPYLTIYRQLFELLSSDGAPRKNVCAGLCFSLIQYLVEENSPSATPEVLRNIQHYIQRNLEARIALEDLECEFNLSRSSINNLFRKYLNISTYRYITQQRMGRAGIMLREGNLSVKETAAALGFTTQFNFSKEFKKYFGVSPRKFRLNGNAELSRNPTG